MELSPDALRDVRFTERFRGYDAAEVDAFMSKAAAALEELVAEHSAPMAALAAEQARLAIEEVRQQTLAEVAELQARRDELAEAIADLQSMLADRRRGLVEALALIDAAGEPATVSGDGAASEDAAEVAVGEGAGAGRSHEAEAAGEDAGDGAAGDAGDAGDAAAGDRADAAAGDAADAAAGDGADAAAGDGADVRGGDGADVQADDGTEVEGDGEAEVTDSFLARLERAAAESRGSSG